MRLSTTLIALSAGVAHAGFGLNFGGGEITVNEDLKIPGNSPLELCPKAHDDDILTIEKVDLVPNPPKAGQDLVIKASGTLAEAVEEGAYVALQVKYGLIRLISTKADLCEQVHNVDIECPIEKGDITITKTVELPQEIPKGKYTVLADVYTKDDKPVTCLTAQVIFGDSKAAEIEL
ncbi:hypothetical protein VPNG_03223 [Cytospora leucostoma]|uniref:Phosphatidylglycerol/phosphatidylinositol transfer protein n=1 Tax=Cytospora leucostoma TaxID=1230097 RepID=A0A423XEH2_9PEZI|nr:hypothetical protein VPNG_03223 [Cytospora leucostoma]